MKYTKSQAKDYAKKNMRGVWGGALTPFTPKYELDEEAYRFNIRHCIDNINLGGMYVNALQGESLYQTIAERKQVMKWAVDEASGGMEILAYTADPALANCLDMTLYAQQIGADYVGIVNPKFYLGTMTEEGVYQYFKYIADRVDIGIFVLNQMEHGYLMSAELLARIADLENVIGVKNIASQTELMKTRLLIGDKVIISDSSEVNWFVNLTVKGQQAMIADPDPYCLQSKRLKLINDYTELAMKGDIAQAFECYRRLEPIRQAMARAVVPCKNHSFLKYWVQCLGMKGGDGRVRCPHVELTAVEKCRIEEIIATTGLV